MKLFADVAKESWLSLVGGGQTRSRRPLTDSDASVPLMADLEGVEARGGFERGRLLSSRMRWNM